MSNLTPQILTNPTSITNTVDGEDNTILNTTYEYNEKGYITKMTNTFANGEIVSTYSYDDLGRLIEYHPDESSVAYYVYDSKGQLVREDYQFGLASATVTYKYDSRGNIETIKQYPFTRGDITQAPEETENLDFEYDDGIWLDVLSEIGDNPLLYDSQGNLINITDCDVNWTNGRQLSSYSYTNEDGVTEDIIKYNYDENGIRISKEYDGITTYYTTIDGRITSQYEIDETGTKQNEMIFMYNSLNEIIGVQYEDYNYYYLKNAMGDVIGFIDELENHLTIYYYNAWGNHTSGSTINFSSAENSSLSHKLDEINPMRYRGYYLDSELNFFYLQSRYYASDWCRFINADLPEYAQMQKDDNAGTNLFAYCCNDPINNIDSNGYWAEKLIYNIKNNSYDVNVRWNFISKQYCLSFANDLIKNADRVTSRGSSKIKGVWFGMTAHRMAVEIWFHAMVYYGGYPLAKICNKFRTSIWGSANPITVNSDDKRVEYFYVAWYGAAAIKSLLLCSGVPSLVKIGVALIL